MRVAASTLFRVTQPKVSVAACDDNMIWMQEATRPICHGQYDDASPQPQMADRQTHEWKQFPIKFTPDWI